ncbi:MAG: transglutaminase family protein [Candidatus Paceibacterota bacterium]
MTITGGELVDIRTTLTDTCMEIQELGNTISGEAKSHDEAALTCLRAVMKRVSYKSDMLKWNKPERWQSPAETFALGTGDCEDGALMLMTLMDAADIPAWRRKVACGYVLEPRTNKRVGHAYVIYLKDDFRWYCLDWCYYPVESIENYLKNVPHSELKKYYDLWWTFNQEHSWAQHATLVR